MLRISRLLLALLALGLLCGPGDVVAQPEVDPDVEEEGDDWDEDEDGDDEDGDDEDPDAEGEDPDAEGEDPDAEGEEPEEPVEPTGEPYEPQTQAPSTPRTLCHGRRIRQIQVEGGRRVEPDPPPTHL